MKTHVQPTAALTQLGQMVEKLSVAMLTTLDSDGQLVSRPMSPLEMDNDGAIWFFTSANSTKVDQLRHLNLSFCSAENGIYVSVCGSGKVVVDPVRNKALWSTFAKPWFPDGSTSTELTLIKITPTTAEYWDTPSSKMVRLFAMAASVVAGKPVGLGEHDKLNLKVKRHSTTSPA